MVHVTCRISFLLVFPIYPIERLHVKGHTKAAPSGDLLIPLKGILGKSITTTTYHT